MQKGFASLEVILVVLIISLLATVAVPNAATFVDKAALDYEQKLLYSELEFVRTQNRTASLSTTGINMVDFFTSKGMNGQRVIMEFDHGNNGYRFLRDEKPIGQTHYLSYGVTFSNETEVPGRIWFEPSGAAVFMPIPNSNSVTIVLKSPRASKSKIVFDSVGRIRGGK